MASEVLDHEARRWAALIENDLDALEDLLHPQLTYTHSNALVDTKQSYVASIANGVVKYLGFERDDVAVTEIGDTAVITGKVEFTVHAQNRDIDIKSRFSAVWIRDDGRWQLLLWQNTPFPPS